MENAILSKIQKIQEEVSAGHPINSIGALVKQLQLLQAVAPAEASAQIEKLIPHLNAVAAAGISGSVCDTLPFRRGVQIVFQLSNSL
jgi:hypothetical protein